MANVTGNQLAHLQGGVNIIEVGPIVHGVECYEAWRDDQDCPHEQKEQSVGTRVTTLTVAWNDEQRPELLDADEWAYTLRMGGVDAHSVQVHEDVQRTCRYCGEPVEKAGYVHAGGCFDGPPTNEENG